LRNLSRELEPTIKKCERNILSDDESKTKMSVKKFMMKEKAVSESDNRHRELSLSLSLSLSLPPRGRTPAILQFANLICIIDFVMVNLAY